MILYELTKSLLVLLSGIRWEQLIQKSKQYNIFLIKVSLKHLIWEL